VHTINSEEVDLCSFIVDIPFVVAVGYQSSRMTSLSRESPSIAKRSFEPVEWRPFVSRAPSSRLLLWKAYPVISWMKACAASIPDAMLATICLINGNSVG
jgi:hypothetical protein